MRIRPTTYDLAMAEADYPARTTPPERSILLCSHMRSGSTMLGEILYFANGLGCPLEYFHRGFRPGFESRWGTQSADEYMQKLHSLRTDPSGVFSTKLFWQDVIALAHERQPEHFAGLDMRDAIDTPDAVYRDILVILERKMPNPTFIYLSRRDFVRQAVSSVTAAQSGIWRTIPGQELLETEAVEYDHNQIARAIAVHRNCARHWERFFAVNVIAPHRVDYEELKADPQRVTRETLAFLGRPYSEPTVRMQAQSSAKTEAYVRRFMAELTTSDTASKPSRLLQPDVH